ncbi:unnamed protein product [Albugo candida]|uniref:Uncharacterized protein n=1 Tax=Albugo candida TaxID=65357 RepID=A0A024G1T2_9STRA|nr:unnamed protein product [Albugo candida]|eukprot:CCI40268.1 unnamed protein product [Albugo candida]
MGRLECALSFFSSSFFSTFLPLWKQTTLLPKLHNSFSSFDDTTLFLWRT